MVRGLGADDLCRERSWNTRPRGEIQLAAWWRYRIPDAPSLRLPGTCQAARHDMNTLVSFEPLWRATVFFSVLALLLIWERRAGLRTARPARAYLPNILLFLTNTVVTRIVSVYALLGVSLYGSANDIGLLRSLGASSWTPTARAALVGAPRLHVARTRARRAEAQDPFGGRAN